MVITRNCAFTLVCLFLCSLVMAFGAAPAFAQGFNFSNFGSTAGLTLKGNAAQFGSGSSAVLRLTPATTAQAGSAWFNTQQSVSKGFTTTFQFRITPSGTPADGFAFVIQNSAAGTGALGPAGGGIGYGSNPDSPGTGITNSLAIEFDTYPNTGDPNANHIAIQNCGTGANSSDETARYPVGEEGTLPCNLGTTDSELPITLADGNIHTVVINYDSSSDFCEGPGLTVYLDGNTPILQHCFSLTGRLSLGEGGAAFVGFTAATGAAFENHDILNWSFSPHSGQTTNAILTFNPGTNVSQVAKFNCTTFNEDGSCADQEAHSLKLTASKVTQTFSLVVSATQVTGDGSCESGNPNDSSDFDCRFVNHFGTPGISPAVTVPLCDPYDFNQCVYYRIENPPDTSKYQGPIYWYIAWNDDTFVSSLACAAVTMPTTYQCGNRQMADDPSSGHPLDPNQFTQYITSFFTSNGGQVGKDPGVGGTTKNFNDVAVVFPQTVGNVKFIPLLPFTNEKVEQSDKLPVVFSLLQGSKVISNATKAPNALGVAVLDSSGVRQPIAAPGSNPPQFTFLLGTYVLGLDTSQLVPGSYTLVISSNLFANQTIPFTVVPEDSPED